MRNQQAISFIELLLVLALCATLAAFAMPSFSHMLDKQRVLSSCDHFKSLLRVSRYLAIAANMSVVICPTVNGTRCHGQWSQGQLVFLDSSGDAKVKDKEQLLLHRQTLSPQLQLKFKGFTANNFIRFSRFGSTLQNGTYTFTTPNTVTQCRIIISATGRIRKEIKQKS